jgi:hypothetical protein
MVDIDFDSRNVIVIVYPIGSGGKTLANCLSFADNCLLFFDVNKSFQTVTTQKDKFDLIMDRLSNVNDYWNDLALYNAYNAYSDNKSFQYIEELRKLIGSNLDKVFKLSDLYHWNQVEAECSVGNKKFLICCHSIEEAYFYKKVWKNAQIVYFEKTFKFIKKYRNNHIARTKDKETHGILKKILPVWREYKAIKGTNWPAFPLYKEQWDSMPYSVINEINNITPGLVQRIKNCLIISEFYKELKYSNDCFFWDTESFLNKKAFLANIAALYTLLGLVPADPVLLEQYYTAWLGKINQLFKEKQKKQINYKLETLDELLVHKQTTVDEIKYSLSKLDFKTATEKLNKLKKILICINEY